jgi:hypothetical protein
MPIKFFVYGLVYPPGHYWAGELAYIGKGNKNRLKYRKKHINYDGNILLVRMKNKYGDPSLVILGEFDNEQDAFAFEIEKIAELGTINDYTGKLCNMTKGGEGPSGLIQSQRQREIVSVLMKGKPKSLEQRRKMSEVAQKETNRQAVSERFKGKPKTPEANAKRAASLREYFAKLTPEQKAKRASKISQTLLSK